MRKAREAFGGMKLSFKTVENVTLGEVFGEEPITPAEMTSKLWAFIKKAGLAAAAKAMTKAV